MGKKLFDNIISSKLSAHKTKRASDWQSMKEKWEAASMQDTDELFDDTLSSRLADYKTHANDPQWPLLSQRYQLVMHLRNNIRSIKLLEACIMLLLLLMLGTMGSLNKANKLAINENYFIDNSKIPEDNKNSLSQYKPEILNANDITEPGESTLLKAGLNSEEVQMQQTVLIEPRTALDIEVIKSSNDQDIRNPVDSGQSGSDVKNSGSQVMHNNFELLASLSTLPLKSKLLSSHEVIDISSDHMAEVHINVPVRRSGAWLSIYSSFDNNLIYTPDDPKYNTDSRKTEMHGYSLGILLSRKTGAFEWGSGLSYSLYNKPWDFTLQYGNSNGWYSFIMTNIHYKIVSVPMLLQYHIVENHDWSMLTNVGLSHSFIADSQYQKVNTYLGGGAIPVGGEIPEPEDGASPFENDRKFTQGILQGESLKDSYFLRCSIGVGIQRNISQSLALNFSGNYYRSLVNTRIGPNNDRLDKFNITFGLKMKIR